MKAINLFSYTRVKPEYASDFFNIMSNSEHKSKVRTHEFTTTQILVDELVAEGVSVEMLEGFFASFVIKQIGKEFDLLKIEPDKYVLDIELKCEPVDDADMLRQLRQNRYYLGHLASDCALFTFVGSTRELYRLIDQECVRVDLHELITELGRFDTCLTEGIEKLFTPNCYLISPLNTPQKFLYGNYFLTQNQQEIRNQIFKSVNLDQPQSQIFGIRGSAGTGKTLLLYDMAKGFAELDVDCCIIHCGKLCEGQKYLNSKVPHIEIYSAEQLTESDLSWLDQYRLVFVDEAQQINKNAFIKLVQYISPKYLIATFSYDEESGSNAQDYLQGIENVTEFRLSARIRTSAEITSFFRSLMNLNNVAHEYMDYSNISVFYANDDREAEQMIHFYSEIQGYTLISCVSSADPDTHHVLGQEFDKVMIVMDDSFIYDDEGCLREMLHPDQDQLFSQLLYQNISRARENLLILVVHNESLFENIAFIKINMLEKYQYRTGPTNPYLSRKKINKLVKSIKDSLTDIPEKDASAINDNIDIIVDELLSADPRKKVIRNSINYLELILERNPSDTVREFIDTVLS